MDFKVNNKVITEPIKNILLKLKSELKNGKLNDIIDKGDNYLITCPVHKGGHESHPSCQIYADRYGELEYGKVHCFTCGYVDNLSGFIEKCFDELTPNFGIDWLLERFGATYVEELIHIPELTLKREEKKIITNIDKYKHDHDYLINRGISKDIIDKFNIGYDPKLEAVVFPVYDEHGDLTLITKRSVKDKKFYIDEDVKKPVYLLDTIIKENIKTVYVCESQINALTLWSWGYPAIALIGTGSVNQYPILNKSGIRNYILCFDGDEAGDKGIERFKRNIRDDVFICVKKIPRTKDINDLKKDEFLQLETV